MSFPFLHAAAAATALLIAAPAAAQQFSEGYEFLEAIRKEDGTKVMEILNKPGVRIIDTKDRNTGEAALHIVAKSAKPSSLVYLRFLLQRGANPNVQDSQGNSAMLLATNIGFNEAVQVLVTYKANVNQRNSRGETPLIRAVQLRNLELVNLLLQSGADPDLADASAGLSARDYAKADTRSPAIAKALADAPRAKPRTAVGPQL